MSSNIKDLQSYFESELENLKWKKKPKELYEPIQYIMSLGGKRMRPVLLLAAAEMFGANKEQALNQAIAIEIFHNFSLVHDDLMDNAPLRRKKATVHTKWNNNIAILSGDVMMIYAYDYLIKCSPNVVVQVMQEFNNTAIEVCEGQQMDMNFESILKVNIADYLKMIRLKTAELLAGSLKIGALIAGAESNNAQLMAEFGLSLGISFQLQDDLLDVYGEPSKFGKRPGGDILANKKTYLLVRAMEMAEGNDKKTLEYWLSATAFNPDEKIAAVTEIYNGLGIRQLVNLKIKQYFDAAMLSLDTIDIPEMQKIPLRNFAQSLLIREI
jgi:geranylgeranyl diphosphate synthase type II